VENLFSSLAVSTPKPAEFLKAFPFKSSARFSEAGFYRASASTGTTWAEFSHGLLDFYIVRFGKRSSKGRTWGRSLPNQSGSLSKMEWHASCVRLIQTREISCVTPASCGVSEAASSRVIVLYSGLKDDWHKCRALRQQDTIQLIPPRRAWPEISRHCEADQLFPG
jgi:hypothetical protein